MADRREQDPTDRRSVELAKVGVPRAGHRGELGELLAGGLDPDRRRGMNRVDVERQAEREEPSASRPRGELGASSPVSLRGLAARPAILVDLRGPNRFELVLGLGAALAASRSGSIPLLVSAVVETILWRSPHPRPRDRNAARLARTTAHTLSIRERNTAEPCLCA